MTKEEHAKVLEQTQILRDIAYHLTENGYSMTGRDIKLAALEIEAAIMRKEPEPPTVKESFTVAEQSRELDAGMAAQHYCRGLWGAARGHSDWRKVHEHFANGYKQGCHDNEMAQGPYPWPDDPLDLELRGLLASKLKCWHRLSGPEATELVALFEGLRQKEPEPISDADAMGFAVMEHLGPSALTGGTMTILEAFELGWNARALLEKAR